MRLFECLVYKSDTRQFENGESVSEWGECYS